MRRGLLVAMAAGCARSPDAAVCHQQLAAKLEATVACAAAYRATPTVDAAKQLALAFAAHGDVALDVLLALNPTGQIAAEVWHKRAGKLRDSDDIDGSIHAYERALALRGSDPHGQVRELSALSAQYEARDDAREALLVQARAYEAAVASPDPLDLAHVRIALASELGLVGDLAGAERALGDSAERVPLDDSYLPYALLLQGGIDLFAHGRPLLARVALERVQTLHDEGATENAHRNLIDVAFAQADLAEAARLVASDPIQKGPSHASYAAHVALAQGHLDEATRWIERGLATRDPGLRSELEIWQAEVLAKQGREAEAVKVLESAILDVEARLDQLGIDELKGWQQTDSDRRAPYEHLFAIHARAGRAGEALAVVQRATARAFLDGLTARSTVAPGQDIAELARAAGVRVEALHVIARSLRASAAAHAPDAATLVRELGDAIVWTYFAADGELWLVALDHGAATVDDLGPLAELRGVIDGAAAFDEPSLAKLGARLAPPARRAHLELGSVVHVAAGPLDRVPFAALVVDGQRWIERFAIAYVPSAAVLAILTRSQPSDGSMVVLGDPLGDLPGARTEAEATARRLGTAPRLGATATAAAVLGAAHAAVLAIGSHAETSPGGASLRLADRAVTTADIIDHALAPRLVVLASCASAAVDADAWGALAGAFLAAGTPNVVASRWALDDKISRDLLGDFYDAGGVAHSATALAAAQRAAIAHQVPVSAWAALVALGTGESNQPKGTQSR